MNKKDEDRFDEMSWELQLMAAKVGVFMQQHNIDWLTMSVPNGWVLSLGDNKKWKPSIDHGLDEKRSANGE